MNNIKFYEDLSKLHALNIKPHDSIYFNRYKERVKKFVQSYLKSKNKTILDVGCGYGDNIINLVSKEQNNIIGIDISRKCLQIAEERTTLQLKLIPIQADAQYFPFKDNSIDIILCSHIIEHLNKPNLLIAQAHRVLKQKGLLILSTPNGKCISRDQKYRYFYKPMRKLLFILTKIYIAKRDNDKLSALNQLRAFSSKITIKYGLHEHIHEFGYNELINLLIRANFKLEKTNLTGFMHDDVPHDLLYSSDMFGKKWDLLTRFIETIIPLRLRKFLLLNIVIIVKKC